MEIEKRLKEKLAERPTFINKFEFAIYLTLKNFRKGIQPSEEAINLFKEIFQEDPFNIIALDNIRSYIREFTRNPTLNKIISSYWSAEDLKLMEPSKAFNQFASDIWNMERIDKIFVIRALYVLDPPEKPLIDFIYHNLAVVPLSDPSALIELMRLISHFCLPEFASLLEWKYEPQLFTPEQNRHSDPVAHATDIWLEMTTDYPFEYLQSRLTTRHHLHFPKPLTSKEYLQNILEKESQLPDKIAKFYEMSNVAKRITIMVKNLTHKEVDLGRVNSEQRQNFEELFEEIKGSDNYLIIKHNYSLEWVAVAVLARAMNKVEIAKISLTIATKGKHYRDISFFHKGVLNADLNDFNSAKEDLFTALKYSDYIRFFFIDIPEITKDQLIKFEVNQPKIWCLFFYHFLKYGRGREARMAFDKYSQFDTENKLKNSTSEGEWINWAIQYGKHRRWLTSHYAQDKVEMGNYYKEKGMQQDAIEAYKQAIDQDDQTAEAWYQWGLTLVEMEEMTQAILKLERANELDSENFDAWMLAGFTLEILGRKAEAVQNFERALDIDSNRPEPWESAGWLLNELLKHDEALSKFEKLVYLKPAEGWYGKACTYAHLKRAEEAIIALEQTFSIDNTYIARAKEDTDLDFIRQHSKYIQLIKQFSK